MSSQASLSVSTPAGPLSPPPSRSCSWPAKLARTAAALALSSAAAPASAFVSSPLHGAAPGRAAAPAPVGSGPSCADDRSAMCPPLVMVLTDPETLLRDADMEARMWRRGRGVGPSSSSSSAKSKKVDAAYLEGLSALKLDISGGNNDFSASSPLGDTGIKVVKAKTQRKKKKKKSKSAAAAVRAPQTIESEIEVVAEPAKSGAARAPRGAASPLRAASPVAPAARARATVTPSDAGAETSADVAGVARSSGKKAGGSRSSTMPGFASGKDTFRRRGHRDGIALVERRTGRTIKDAEGVGDAKTKRRRRKANSEAMYKGSASVPDSLIAFTNEIHEECDRITPTEEIELGTLTQEAIRIQTLHDDLESSLGRAPSDEEWCAAAGKINAEALRNAIDDGMEAKNQLVTSNLRMVQGVVNLYIRNGLGSQYNAGDLMQEGILALIRAAEKFDPSKGFRFSTYAMYWIRASVKRSQVLQSRIVQVPQRLHETHKRVLKTERELRSELGRRPTDDELAQASDLSVVQLKRCLKAMAQECHSLDATIQNTLNPNKSDVGRKDTMYALVDSKREDDGRRDLLQRFSRESLVDTLRRYLTPHEADLLLLRYGLMDERTLPHGFSGPLTIAEVSRLVGLKPDKVRRMINGCLRQLKPLIAHEWENFENELP